MSFAVCAVGAVMAIASFVPGDDSAITPVEDVPTQVDSAISLTASSDGRNGNVFALAGGQTVFPLPYDDLSSFANAPVEMQGVVIRSVVPELGMWVGPSDQQRVFVTLSQKPDRGSLTIGSVVAGQVVNLSGRMLAPRFVTSSGLAEGPDRDLLIAQGQLVEAVSIRPTKRP